MSPLTRQCRPATRRALSWFLPLALFASGCAVSENDLDRWRQTEQGPRKLHAVATHDKYDPALRLSALKAIVEIPTRSGKNIALPILIEGFHDDSEDSDKPGALTSLPEDKRPEMIQGLAPFLVAEMTKAPPAKKPDGTKERDTSVPAKDAAFAMLSHEPPLVTDPQIRAQLTDGIVKWALADFDARLDMPQKYGVEQMFKLIGKSAAAGLPGLLREESTKIDRITAIISDLGDADAKLKASNQLVSIARSIDSQAWIQKKMPEVRESNEKAKLKATDQQVAEQLRKYQEQELFKVFSSMKKVGQKPATDFLIGYASKKDHSEDRRKNALAGLEGHVDKTNVDLINKLNDVASDDATPDGVRDLAFARLGELPKDVVVPRMYKLFDAKKWKVRWVAGSLVLKSIQTNGLPEFMARLPRAGKISLTEVLNYGQAIQTMEGSVKPKDAVVPYLSGKDVPPKLVALSYFYKGKKADLGLVLAHESDTSPVPKCDKEDECGWSCDIPKPGTQDTEAREIRTVGDFAKYCVAPSIK